MSVVQLNIPMGYYLKEEYKTLPIEQVRDLLLTKKRRTYTNAVRDDYHATLRRHYIQCPNCNHRVYAYARRFNKFFEMQFPLWENSRRSIVLDWTSQQMTLFKEERKPLFLNEPVGLKKDLVCPACKNTMQYSKRTRFVEIKREDRKVLIRVEVADVSELFALPCLAGARVKVEFPLYEVVCFNFRNGHTYLYLESASGNRIGVRDMTSEKYAWKSGSAYQTISKNKYVRRIIGKMFQEEWGAPLPFFPSELGTDKLRILTMFIGYEKGFYSTIPFGKSSLAVEKSFKLRAKKMRNAYSTISMYENSSLPNIKSIRKIFFENKGLFFYLEECERLWALLKDPNYFAALMKEREIFQILSDLHMRPMIFLFMEDYLRMGRVSRFMKLLHRYWRALCKYAVNYSSMSAHMQKEEQARWQKHKRGRDLGSFPNFAIPMCPPTERIRDCSIDEFEFFWLKNSMDYEEAGTALNNCLRGWSPYSHPVICVRKEGEIIAALEVRGDFVYQAYTANNEQLNKIPGLLKAYSKWHAKNHLSGDYVPIHREYDDDDDEEDFLGDYDLPL